MAGAGALLLLAPLCRASAIDSVSEGAAGAGANPIRKVVTLLQKMQKRVVAEGEKEQELYDKFKCYCKTGDADLAASISTAEGKIPDVGSSIREAAAQKVQLEHALQEHQAARGEAKDAVAKATAIREKDAATYSKQSADYKVNIQALESASAAISKGMSGGFLQTNTAAIVRRIALNGPAMSDVDRHDLLAFLSGRRSSGFMPSSGEITGILGQLAADMKKTLKEITEDEKSSIVSYGDLMSAKKKEILTLTGAIEEKLRRVGELAVQIAAEKRDLDDTEQALLADQGFLAALQKDCGSKAEEWEARKLLRSEELAALAETIKVLNDDEALEIFKKTLPSTGFLQVGVNARTASAKVIAIVSKAARAAGVATGTAPQLDLIALALHGKQIGLEKVVKMIDDLVAVLKKEQVDDDSKREYCTVQLDETEDKQKGLDKVITDHETTIADAEEGIAALKTEMKALEAGIKELDARTSEASEQRKEENAEYNELLASNSQAKEILEWAKNRLAKFYNPKLHKPAMEPAAEQGSVLAQVAAHRQVRREAPPPAPETFGRYQKKTEESAGAGAMIDLLIRDLDKEINEAQAEEKSAQANYEETIKDSATKRESDSKLLAAKESAKVGLETALETHKEGKAATSKELLLATKFMASLHVECDWLLKYYDVRREARNSEMDSLSNAKAVLSGADFSLLQKTPDSRPRLTLRQPAAR